MRFEFFSGIVKTSVLDGNVRLPDLRLQPIAADEAVTFMANLATAEPGNSIVELGGPEPTELVELARVMLTVTEHNRPVAIDPASLYFSV